MLRQEVLQEPIVCLREVMTRLGGNERMYERMLRKLPADRTLAKAQEAFAQKNRQDFTTHIHAVRGLALNLGFSSLAELAAQLDTHLRDESYTDQCFLNEAAKLEQQLSDLTERYQTVLEAVRQALGEEE